MLNKISLWALQMLSFVSNITDILKKDNFSKEMKMNIYENLNKYQVIKNPCHISRNEDILGGTIHCSKS